MPSKMPFRNPYPIPDVSTEGYWIPPGPVLGGKVTITDRRWYKKLDPHERLFAHHTLNSIRKDQRFVRTKAPDDALDFALTSVYVHNEDTLVPKMYVSMQPESLGFDTWRVLRNELKTSSPEFGIPSVVEQNGESEWEIEAEVRDETPKSAPGAKIAKSVAKARLAARAKTAAGAKSVRTKAAVGSKMAADFQKASRAATAPAGSLRATRTRELHQYADGSRYVGLPDRIERIHASSLKLAIEGPHSDQTKAGYSRKEDGTFYGL